MIPKLEILSGKKLVGMRLKMTFSNDKTFKLWSTFMPVRNEVKNVITADLFSMQIYNRNFDFSNFDLDSEFEKWAAVEVADFEFIPPGMQPFILESGLYAVFIHKGASSSGQETFRHIFGTWLPGSDYLVDGRPHFEILGEKYKHDDPGSEEEVWIPVKQKKQ
jgi:AraC family transcriptional regulator